MPLKVEKVTAIEECKVVETEVREGVAGTGWKKITKTRGRTRADLRKTYAKLDFKFLGAIRRGLNYSKDRKPSCVDDSLRRCNFPWRYAALSRWKKTKKGGEGGMVKRSRRRSKSTVASRLYFKDILRFPRVILVMIANRNQQGTFRTLANDPGAAFLCRFDRHLVNASSISFEFLSKVILSIEILYEKKFSSFTIIIADCIVSSTYGLRQLKKILQ